MDDIAKGIAELENIPRWIDCKARKSNPEYNRLYQRIYILMLKKWAIEKLGRKCRKCGLVSEYDCIYDFHHEDKTKSWSKGDKHHSDARNKELRLWRLEDKIPEDVWLLCSNCQRIEHLEDEVEKFREKFKNFKILLIK